MAEKSEITQEKFDSLLTWLDRNRDIAGQKYEKIRTRLVRIFVGRGCADAEDLADETMNRVTLKFPQLAADFAGEPERYFYGVARNVHLEWTRRRGRVAELPDEVRQPEMEDREGDYRCLESCLSELDPTSRSLIIEYYSGDKTVKIHLRRDLAARLNLSTNALHVKASRIRSKVRVCVDECVSGTNVE